MIRDERGLPLSTGNREAAALFDRAVEHYLKFHADTPARIGEAGHPLLVPHLMMALEATGRHEEADRFLAGRGGRAGAAITGASSNC